MKKVAFLYDHVLDLGGVENHLLSLAKCLPKEEYEFSILSQSSPGFRARAEGLGCRVVDQPSFHPLDPAWTFHLLRQIRALRLDLLHVHGPNASGPGRLAALLAGIPCLVTNHLPVSRYHGSRQTLRARLGRSLYTAIDSLLNHLLPDPLIYVSQSIFEEETRAGRVSPHRGQVIPNGVALDIFVHPELEAQRNSTPLQILFAGRLSHQKGLDLLIAALSQLPSNLPAYRCQIVGYGEDRTMLQEQARGLGESIRFLGFRADIPLLMARADIFVLPSRYEALPIALLEAMASGLPCLVSEVGDCPRLALDGPGGVVVPPGDSAALARELERLLRDSSLRQSLGAAARKTAQAFSEQETARRVNEVYARLIRARGPSR